MSSPKLGKKAYKVRKADCIPPDYHWIVGDGCFNVEKEEKLLRSSTSTEEKTSKKDEMPSSIYNKLPKNVKTDEYLIEMLGPLYEKCKNEGITIEELQEHINNLFKEGKCKSCKV